MHFSKYFRKLGSLSLLPFAKRTGNIIIVPTIRSNLEYRTAKLIKKLSASVDFLQLMGLKGIVLSHLCDSFGRF